jgi:hypothetical protein
MKAMKKFSKGIFMPFVVEKGVALIFMLVKGGQRCSIPYRRYITAWPSS